MAALRPSSRSATSVSPRALIWLFHVALPVAGLALLLGRPELDLVLEHHVGHFWLVLATALTSVALAGMVGIAASRHDDARLFLVALAFATAAGFFALHALSTPAVLLSTPNASFVLSTPIGVTVAAVFGLVSAVDLTPRQARLILRRRSVLVAGLVVALVAWAIASIVPGSPLRAPLPDEPARPWRRLLSAVGIALYLAAAVGYLRLYRRRPSVVLLSIITAFVLLAEALVALAEAPSWHVSWWEWHVLMTLAFAYVAYSARVQYQREGTTTTLFRAISLEETVRRLRDEYGAALEGLVAAIDEGARTGRAVPLGAVGARLAANFGLTEGQTEILGQAAESLASEREQSRRLGGLVAVGRETGVILDETTLLDRAVGHLSDAFEPDRLSVLLVRDGRLVGQGRAGSAVGPPADPVTSIALESRSAGREPTADGGERVAFPLVVKDHPAGVLVLERSGREVDERSFALLTSAASQLSIAVENARLYGELDHLFRSYISPDVATALLADPEQARLGGAVMEVTILFADLRGFTPFAESATPEEVVALLNEYFGRIVPIVIAEGGTVVQFIGDAIMAIWNAPARQPDHPLRAARAALAMQATIAEAAGGRPDMPRFRIGIETGPAVVGNVGSSEVRSYTAIGDTTNLAARLQTAAEVGQVVVGPTAAARLGSLAVLRPLGELVLKGKAEPVPAFELTGLAPGQGLSSSSR